MSQLLEQRLRGANPVPNPTDPPSGAWSADVALLEIERRSDSVETIERTKTEPSGPKRNRGWLLAAAVAALVVLVGAVVIGLQGGSDTDVVEPTPTTLSAPTTVPTPTTTPQVTTVPPTTAPQAPATTAPATTIPPPQVYDATLTWDGETCTFDGPTEARRRDSLILTAINNSSGPAYFLGLYMTSGTTIDDANAHFDEVLGNRLTEASPGWLWPGPQGPEELTPPPEYVFVEESDSVPADGALVIRTNDERDETFRLSISREYLFVCSTSIEPGGGRTGDRVIDNAPQTIKVTD